MKGEPVANKKTDGFSCPSCDGSLVSKEVHEHVVLRCLDCGGIWLSRETIDKIKEGRDESIEWPDNLSEYAGELEVEPERKMECPGDGAALVSVKYGSSSVIVDVCPVCGGVWFDHGEFGKVAEDISDAEVEKTSLDYLKNFMRDLAEVVTGDKTASEELGDAGKTWHLFINRLAIDHPLLHSFVVGAGESFA